jgi:CheY-like chemotaxis protein
VFDPFFTTKGASKGSGLGLSQVYGFAHQSGGTVTIESELGAGTRVTLYLPRALEAAAAAAPEEASETAAGGRVLLVEDNPEVADVSVSMLDDLGYRVVSVSDAAAALDALDRDDFDLVISDIVMAGNMDGLALGRAVRERAPGLPVLLVTGFSRMLDEAGAEFTVLRKPFKLADLSRTAAHLIARAKQPPASNVVPLRTGRPPETRG